jgi:hypothetical protein
VIIIVTAIIGMVVVMVGPAVFSQIRRATNASGVARGGAEKEEKGR